MPLQRDYRIVGAAITIVMASTTKPPNPYNNYFH
jgi:hypothetical protein